MSIFYVSQVFTENVFSFHLFLIIITLKKMSMEWGQYAITPYTMRSYHHYAYSSYSIAIFDFMTDVKIDGDRSLFLFL